MGYKDWKYNQFNVADATTTAAKTNASLKAAPGAGLRIYITDIWVSNEGAANVVSLLNGSGGAAKWMAYLPINGFVNLHFNVPIRLDANTGLFLTTTANDHCVVYVNGFVNK